MDKQTAIQKIRKCLALAASSEPHEAAAALRQAQKLMAQHCVEHPELLAAGVTEGWSKSCASKVPPRFEVSLASAVASAFGCDLLFSRRLNGAHTAFVGGYLFIGAVPSPEVATYTFSVLSRQLKKARTHYIDTALKRHRKNKTTAADMFCVGWMSTVRNLIAVMAPTASQAEAIDAYMRIHHAKTSALAVSNRQLTNTGAAVKHVSNGLVAGRNARLNRGVGNHASNTAQLGQS